LSFVALSGSGASKTPIASRHSGSVTPASRASAHIDDLTHPYLSLIANIVIQTNLVSFDSLQIDDRIMLLNKGVQPDGTMLKSEYSFILRR
jgi:hypothetical protein